MGAMLHNPPCLVTQRLFAESGKSSGPGLQALSLLAPSSLAPLASFYGRSGKRPATCARRPSLHAWRRRPTSALRPTRGIGGQGGSSAVNFHGRSPPRGLKSQEQLVVLGMRTDPTHWEPLLLGYARAFHVRLRQRVAVLGAAAPPDLAGWLQPKAVTWALCADGMVLRQVPIPGPADQYLFKAVPKTVADYTGSADFHGLKVDSIGANPFEIQLVNLRMVGISEEVKDSVVNLQEWIVVSNARSGRWSEERARAEADDLVLSSLTGMALQMPASQPSEVADALGKVADEFESLLDSDPSEEQVQVFLKEHRVLLSPTCSGFYPKHKLGTEYVTDFVVQDAEEVYTLVELEAPGHALFTGSGDFTREVNHAIRQVENWLQWVGLHVSYAQQSLPGIVDPRGIVIIGRSKDLPRARRRDILTKNRASSRITLATYDDILERARAHSENLRRAK